MRTILNVSLPGYMADLVKEEVKSGKYSSMSEFVRKLLRDWEEKKVLREIRESEKELKAGKGILLKSLRDLR